MAKRIYMVPLWVRLWHWCNAALFLTLIYSGASLHFAALDQPALLLEFSVAREVHNTAGITLAVLFFFYVMFTIRNREWGQYAPIMSMDFLRALIKQAKFYGVDIFTGAPHPYEPKPEARFNPLQRITYFGVAYMGIPLMILTGLAYMFPQYAPDRILGMGGLWPLALLHYLLGLFLTVFLVMHIYMATMGRTLTSDLRMMFTGYHEHEEHEK
ncbi:cytochrome b/b6 domain-containing protein [Magnetofaba australis]|nr:cytochrome b/b6 domain-containing protein [Magnetofaba australis]